MEALREWKRVGYKVVEVPFDFDLHHFEVHQADAVVYTIEPDSIDQMNQMIAALDNDESVEGWEDGKGNTIYVE